MIAPETGGMDDTGRMRDPDTGDGESMRKRMTASRRNTEAYFAVPRDEKACEGETELCPRGAKAIVEIDYKAVKREAKTEYRKIKVCAARAYEKKLDEARDRFLRNTLHLREDYRSLKEKAREELRQLLTDARERYEFTVDMVRDMRIGPKKGRAGGVSKKTTRKIMKIAAAVESREG